ncbi:hypothetical protein H4R33_000675 [Dimargaris cristalligena]|uniref:hydroxyacid-oxoacid transhydrogenase n=1 Tax=Dimargaris cristalligena TaxID=215637 RepID=A0A4Q0A367_9FUNG|nr:hypothetical protein H4R33_000675 [Dimargaris cristalligena]RKP40318.1 mitochondrial hydroxyacid-oxoacid transhydrogenase [Dimargaris cristalligena]|eukprot:RKP40318.1 mitochondrial hydroxyacid-oxoacid transhydrogenase [Dimargaris cristalligena]
MASSILTPAARSLRLLQQVGQRCLCPAHARHPTTPHVCSGKVPPRFASGKSAERPAQEYAFEMASSNIRFGEGATREVGMDLRNLKTKKVCVLTDPNLKDLHPVQEALRSLNDHNVNYVLYDRVRIEPSDASFRDAISFAQKHQVDSFLAVGGGSVMDTAKAANLYSSYPEADFLDFVNAPIGKGRPIDKTLMPLIAIPTTAGTGSETTGTAIFDYKPLRVKTGIAHRALKPLLGIVDPLNTRSMPTQVHLASGLDVLCHAMESYTAIPYNLRSAPPANPLERPAYQGSNPISDVWSIKSLEMVIKYLPRVVKDPLDHEAQSQMLLAATFAGIGFGNAGVHLCHGMSYPISGLNKDYSHPQYQVGHNIVPHGISVAVTAPAVFQFTSQMYPERHMEIAKLFGADTTHAKLADAGSILSDRLRRFFDDLKVPNGIGALGFGSQDIPALVEGTLPQHRVIKLAPVEAAKEDLQGIFEKSLSIY